jgi:hypothetical protein
MQQLGEIHAVAVQISDQARARGDAHAWRKEAVHGYTSQSAVSPLGARPPQNSEYLLRGARLEDTSDRIPVLVPTHTGGNLSQLRILVARLAFTEDGGGTVLRWPLPCRSGRLTCA